MGSVAERQDQIFNLLSSFKSHEATDGRNLTQTNSGLVISPSDRTVNLQDNPSLASAHPSHLIEEQVEQPSTLPATVIQEIVDAYFHHCHNQPYSFFHEWTFRRKLACSEIPHHLLCAVIATALRFSQDPFWGDDRDESAVRFANAAWRSIVSTEFSAHEVADVSTVQSITLLAIFDYTAGRSRHGSAWVKIGVAIRIAQDLRLMLQPPTHLPPEQQEERRRVFWSIFLLDRLASCGRDLPCSILEVSCRLQLPQSEGSWRAGEAEANVTLESFMGRRVAIAGRPQPPYAQVVIVSYVLSRAAQYMLQASEGFGNPAQPPWDPRSELAVIESDLIYLETSLQMHRPIVDVLAEYTVPQSPLTTVSSSCGGGSGGGRSSSSSSSSIDHHSAVLTIFARALFHLSYCILYHPFLLRKKADKHLQQQHGSNSSPLLSPFMVYPSSLLSRSLDTAYSHAKHLTETLSVARDAGYAVRASFYGYCAMVAGYVLSLYTGGGAKAGGTGGKADRAEEACRLLCVNVAFLDELGRSWKSASLLAASLTQLSEMAYRFHPLANIDESINLSPADEELLWSFMDYNSLANGSPEPTSAVGMDSVYWPDINKQWSDLFTLQR